MKSLCGVQLPDYCVTFSNIQAQGISLPTALPAGSNSALFTPLAPSPPNYWPEQARCNANPCINACCAVGPDGFCLDNLLSQGGHYQPGEALLLPRGPWQADKFALLSVHGSQHGP